MPLNENLQKYPIREANAIDSNNISGIYTIADATSSNNSNVNQKQFNPLTFNDSVILITPILFVLTTAGIILYRLKQVKTVSFPCKNCKFYNSNNYLRCAVNPAEVLTEKAKDCRDYTSQDRRFSWYWKGFNKR
jgi:hypothetical protein